MSLSIRNGKWRYRFEINGHVVDESTGLAAVGPNGKEINRRRAADLEAQHRVSILEGRIGSAKLKVRSFSEAAKEFLAYRDKSARASTAKRTHGSMASLVLFFGKSLVTAITSGKIDNYTTWRKEQGCKDVTIRHDLDALSLFFQWAKRQGYTRTNPVEEVVRPSDRDAKREHILSDAEEKLYFAHATGVLHDVGRIMILQGCRPDEVLHIRKKDFDFAASSVTICTSKTEAGTDRVLRLTDEAKAIFARRAADAPESGWLFAGRGGKRYSYSGLSGAHYRVLDALNPCRSCGRRESQHPHGNCETFAEPVQGLRVTPYDCRHTFATRFIQHGGDIVRLQHILGHTDIKITMRYVHLAQADMNAAMSAYNEALREQEAKRKGAVQ